MIRDPIQKPTPNQGPRHGGAKPSAIVMHDTGAHTAASTINWFARSEAGVSAHYLVDLDGTVYQFVDEARAAWHAGLSELDGVEQVNDFSVGIEIVDADDATPYPDAQWQACAGLCAAIALRWRIPLRRIVGHCHVARPYGRKRDPGHDFDWYRFGLDVALRMQ